MYGQACVVVVVGMLAVVVDGVSDTRPGSFGVTTTVWHGVTGVGNWVIAVKDEL